MNGNGLHHIHKRKRVSRTDGKLAYPSSNKWIAWLDRILVVIAIIGPLVTIPQIVQIFLYKNASGVSTLSFLLYTILDFPWLTYGIVHKEKPIIITYFLWIIMNLAVTIGSIIY